MSLQDSPQTPLCTFVNQFETGIKQGIEIRSFSSKNISQQITPQITSYYFSEKTNWCYVHFKLHDVKMLILYVVTQQMRPLPPTNIIVSRSKARKALSKLRALQEAVGELYYFI